MTSPFSPSPRSSQAPGVPSAHEGKSFTAPPIPTVPTPPSPDPRIDRYRPSADLAPQDLEQANHAITQVRSLIIHVEHELRKAAAEASIAKMNYDRAMRRALLGSSGKTVADRQATAEILVEEQETAMRLSELTFDHLKRVSTALRADLSALEAITNNLRAQLKLV